MSEPVADEFLAAVVLAGGTSRRFGSDKLGAPVDGSTVLQRVIAGLPADARIIAVGPPRATERSVRWVREDPPGGGPAAAMIGGLRAALVERPEVIVVVPGDAPAAVAGAQRLLRAWERDPWRPGAVGTDERGVLQPLQLVLTPHTAAAMVAAAGSSGGAGASARRLVVPLGLLPVRLRTVERFDIDTVEQLLAWRLRASPAVESVLAALARVPARPDGVRVLALDGPSGAGKSTLAAALRIRTDATVVAGDDFYNPRLTPESLEEVSSLTDRKITEVVFDWRRLRAEALLPLREGRAATYAAYDWQTHDGRLTAPRTIPTAEVVIVDGVCSARPELADLVDLAVYVGVEPDAREERVQGRPDHRRWREVWERGEQHYFGSIRRPETFDLRV